MFPDCSYARQASPARRAQKPRPGNFPPCRMEWDTPAAATVSGGVGDTMDDVGDRGAPQTEGAAGCGEPVFATATHRPPASAATAAVASGRSAILDPGEAMVFRLARRAAHCPARDGLEMAPGRVEDLLALALKTPAERRTPPDFGGSQGADPADGFREPLLGSAKDPSRAGEARFQGLCSHRSEVYAPALWREALTKLAAVSQATCAG